MFSGALALLAGGLALCGTAAAQQNPVSAATYNNIIAYTSFAAASYADQCAAPPLGSSVLAYVSSAPTGGFATLFKYPAKKQLVLAFRGTSTPQAFDYDLFFTLAPLNSTGTSCPTCLVHSGFQTVWNSLSAPAISAVRAAQAANPSYALYVVGHSLGGGLAAQAAATLAGLGNSLTVYTYGEPRNGNAAWTSYLQGLVPATRYFRVTHANDGVPQIPPPVFGFQHHGTEYWESAPLYGNSQSTTFQCPGTDPTDCNAAQSYGVSPINGAHISYSNAVIGNSLNVVSCGATVP